MGTDRGKMPEEPEGPRSHSRPTTGRTRKGPRPAEVEKNIAGQDMPQAVRPRTQWRMARVDRGVPCRSLGAPPSISASRMLEASVGGSEGAFRLP